MDYTENLLVKYLQKNKLNMASFGRIIKASPATVWNWCNENTTPNARSAWKIHKATDGAVPITHWGFVIINGKIIKVDTQKITV